MKDFYFRIISSKYLLDLYRIVSDPLIDDAVKKKQVAELTEIALDFCPELSKYCYDILEEIKSEV